MKVQVVVNCQDLGDSCLIEHLVYTFGDHAYQFFFVAVPEPEDKGVVAAQLMGVLLVIVTDLAVLHNDSLQEECDFLFVVAMDLLGDETVVAFQQLVLFFFGQPANLIQLGFHLFTQLLVSFSFFLIAVVSFIFVLIGKFSSCLGQVIQQCLSIVIGASHNNGRLSSVLDLLHGGKGLCEVLVSVVGILVQLEDVDHVVGHSLCLFWGNLGGHDGGVAVELFGVTADDLSLQMFCQFDAQLCLSDTCCTDDEHPQHQQKKSQIKLQGVCGISHQDGQISESRNNHYI